MITVVSWNIAMSSRAVEELLVMDAAVALLRGVDPAPLAARRSKLSDWSEAVVQRSAINRGADCRGTSGRSAVRFQGVVFQGN